MKERSLSWFRKLKKDQILVMLLLLGLAIVVLMPVGGEKETQQEQMEAEKDTASVTEQTSIQQLLEEQLVDTLQQVEGVGLVKAAVTLESSGKKVVEKDTPVTDSSTLQKDKDGSQQDSKNSSSEEETVYEQDSQGNQTPYVVSETTPEIRGVIVVAQGGGDPVIQQQIQEAVQALFHVEAHKIKVMKMK